MKTHLVFALMVAALLAFVIGQSRRKTLGFEDVVGQAKRLSAEPYVPREPVRPKALRDLDYDHYRDIRWKDERALWRDLGLPFQAKFFFTGHIHSEPVTIFQVNREGAGQLPFSPNFFDYGKNQLAPADIARGGYAGFRLHYPINRPDYLDEVVAFLGASYFRALGKDQSYGISARGIAIDTDAAKKTEEFPAFTAFWLVEPGSSDRRMKLYALLEGKSVTGAYEFVIEPGAETRMDVRAVLFPRRKAEVFGLAPLTSMFWFGENTSNTFGNFRPEVHDSDGLLIHNGAGEWLWRPLSWSGQKQSSAFEDDGPKGFGLLQRDRDFSHYQDLEAKYHTRPSLWVEPHGSWGKGAVRLIQFPTDNEYTDNVVAFWQPAASPAPGSRLEVSYSLYWYSNSADRPRLGRCLSTRIDSQEARYYRTIVLDFWGEDLVGLPADAKLVADVSSSPGAEISNVVVEKNAYDNTWRASFVVSTQDPAKPHELRCTLKDPGGKPLTETWTYTWMP